MSTPPSQGSSDPKVWLSVGPSRARSGVPTVQRIALALVGICLLLQAASCSQAAARLPSSSTSSSVTDIAITARVKRSGVKRFGINIGGEDFYDSGQLLRNLVSRNPGFEAEAWQSILRCKGATASTCTDGNQYAVWPADFLKGASFEFLSGPAAGLSGTIQASRPSHYPESGVSFDFPALVHAPSAGDFVLVRFATPGNADKGWWTNPAGGATFSTEFHDLAPNSPGAQVLRIHASGAAQSARLDSYFDTYKGRSFIQLNGRYTLAFRAKGVGGNNIITASLNRAGANEPPLFPNKSIHLTSSWRDFSYDWVASENGTQSGPVDLSFSVSGADILLDDVSLSAAAAKDNPTAFRNEVVDALRDLHPGLLRYADNGAATASTIDNMIAPPQARLRAGYSTQATEQEQIPLGLHEFLQLCQAVQAEPWYSLPATTTPEEAGHLIEYLGGAATTPYGAKRAALGQRVPWTEIFPVVHLEFGNELWNADTFYGAAMADPALYGKRGGQVFAGARKSTAFVPARFDLVLGSFAANPWWTGEELRNSDGYDSVAVAPYLFNKLAETGSNEAIFGSMFAEPESLDSRPEGAMAQQAKMSLHASHPAQLAVYEVNLGTDQGDASQTVVDRAVPSLGAGLTVMDHMLLSLRDLGVMSQCTYSLPGYANKFRNAHDNTESTPLWGVVLDMGGPTNRKRPLYLAEQLVNQVILPTMLETTLTGADPVWKQALSRNTDVQIDQAHKLQVFAFSEGKRRSLIVFNLSRQGALPITFSGGAPTGVVRLSQLTAAQITDSNEEQEKVRVVHAQLPNFNAHAPYSVPPYSMTAFEWNAAL